MERSSRAATYDALSRWYSLLSDPSEGRLRRECIASLRLQPGETVIEIGPGPGTDLPALAAKVGRAGAVYAVDVSRGMLRQCRRRLARDRRGAIPHLILGDALRLPFRDNAIDAVLLSFTLELFGESEIPRVLQETARTMHGEGRLGIVSLSNRRPHELATRLYWRAHKALPGLVDCRPIDAERVVMAGGYSVTDETTRNLWGLRVSILVARKT